MKTITHSRQRILAAAWTIAAFACASASAAIVAVQDFDANNNALAGSFNSAVDNLDGGAGDFWGVGSRNAWPQGFPAPGVPFSLADDSVFGYANGAPFATDGEGVFGQNSDLDNDFFAMSDTREWGASVNASWLFDVSGYSSLAMAIDIASDIDAAFSYDAGTFITFSASIDAGAPQTLFSFTRGANALAAGSLRPMDSGNNPDPTHLLLATGDATITKFFAEGGSSTAAGDLYLDKSLAADGSLDTFMTSIIGTGSILTLTLSANMPFEAAAFDNVVVTGVPEPASLALLAIGSAVLMRRRR